MNEYPSFDPYQALMRRRHMQDNPQDMPVVEYDPRDVEELEELFNRIRKIHDT